MSVNIITGRMDVANAQAHIGNDSYYTPRYSPWTPYVKWNYDLGDGGLDDIAKKTAEIIMDIYVRYFDGELRIGEGNYIR